MITRTSCPFTEMAGRTTGKACPWKPRALGGRGAAGRVGGGVGVGAKKNRAPGYLSAVPGINV